MPRAGRILVEGGVYHVYNRLARGERVFADEDEAEAFIAVLREVVSRDELTVFAWCLMSNHFHLAVRTGVVPLDRPMRSLQRTVTRGVNLRRRVFGPLWQARYKAKVISDQHYLDQLIAYIHLNPVSAGMVDDPAEYRWSGHSELLGAVGKPIIGVDDVLRLFGRTRRAARARYVRQLNGTAGEEWIGEQPGRLPWWRLGRPPKEEDEDPETTIRERRAREEMGPDWRPRLDVEGYVTRGAEFLDVDLDDLRSRRRGEGLARVRELLVLLGAERYRLKVKDLAKELRKSPDGMSQALARAARKRESDAAFRADLDRLDFQLSGGSTIAAE